MKTQWQNNW